MSAASHATHRRPRHPSLRGTRITAIAVTGSLSAAGMVLAAGTAWADATPNSQAEGRFLDGRSGGIDLDSLVNLAAAAAENNGEATVADTNPLTVTALNSVVIPIGGLSLLGSNGILDLGAVNQVAIARPNGSSVGASGAVTNDGAIDLGGSSTYPGNATLGLGGLLPSTGVLDDLELELGALSARATQAAGAQGDQDSTYQIADLELRLDSTVLSGLLGPLFAQQSQIDGLTAALTALAPVGSVVDISPLPNIASLLAGIVGPDGVLTDGVLSVNLTSGVITLDFGNDLNNLPPNTPLVPYITAALGNLVPLVEGALNTLTTQVESALDNVTADATLPAIPPLPPLSAPIPGLGGLISGVLAGLDLVPTIVTAGTFDDAIATLLPGVLGLTANVQDEPPNTEKPTGSGIVDEFTISALRVNVLGSTAVVNLASASVGPNFGPQAAIVAPVATGIDPDHGPVAGGTIVTITGIGFEPGSTVSVDGGPPITPDAINGNGTALVYTAPAHAAGPVGVTVTTPGGTTGPLTYTYIPAADTGLGTPVITDPDNGDETTDTTPPITGVGAPGATVTVREGTTVLCTAVVRADRSWTCTPGVALSIGSHTVTATQTLGGRTSGASESVTFRIVSGNGGSGVGGAGTGNGHLPNTGGGFDPLPFGVAGLALLLTGLAMAAQRRTTLG